MVFSVIVPVYNNSSIISRCLDSILKQSFSKFEIIVINDGSTDNLEEVLDQYNDNRLNVINQTNQGVSSARNTGIESSKYDYICFLDSDDEWMPNHLQVLNNLISKHPNNGFYITSHKTTMLDGSIISSNKKLRLINGETTIVEDLFELMMRTDPSIFNTNSVCLHKKVFNDVGNFVEGVKIGEDTDMWYRVAAYNNAILTKEETTIRYRDYSSATRNRSFQYDWIFEKRLDTLLKDDRIKSSKKNNIEKFVNAWKVSKSRHYLLSGNKDSARLEINSIKIRNGIRTKIILTKICFLVPVSILNFYLNVKHRNYYHR